MVCTVMSVDQLGYSRQQNQQTAEEIQAQVAQDMNALVAKLEADGSPHVPAAPDPRSLG